MIYKNCQLAVHLLLLIGVLLPQWAAGLAFDSDVDPAVVGGEEAPPFKYTDWMVAMLRNNGTTDLVWCGGSYIGKDTILIAAHCVNRRSPDTLRFEARRHNWEEPTEKGVKMSAEQIIVHPKFNNYNFQNDIAIVKVKGGLDLPWYPLLDDGNSSSEAQPRIFKIVGWGSTRRRDALPVAITPKLQQAEVDLVPQKKCLELYEGTRFEDEILPMMICANRRGIDTCQGDSGGPLFVDSSIPVIVGLTSFGIGCAREQPGVYTRVSALRSFIDASVGCGPGTTFNNGKCQ